MAYIETPRTDAGNATYFSNGHNLDNFSVENSFLSPLKGKDNLVSDVRNGHGISLKTPRARVPFSDRRNLPGAPGRGEFTPLLQSVAKRNLERNGKISGAPETPAFLKAGYHGSDSPTLPGADVTGVYGSDVNSSAVGDDGTPIPPVASSSAQSTPLAVLPQRDAAGVLTDQGNLMTLREQENIINKIEKENFGLKLKIHFLEESLRKAGPGFNEAALKENTDLKVDRVTFQKDLARTKKMLCQAERDLEAYKRRVEDMQEKAKRKHADENLQLELQSLKEEVVSKTSEIHVLEDKLETAEDQEYQVEKLKGDIEDLEADLREQNRLIDEHDNEIDGLKAQARRDSDELEEVCAKLEGEKLEGKNKRVEELEVHQSKSADQLLKLKEAQEELQEALEAKQKAEEDLDELRDEMSNKSINTKGLSRQLEDKANKLQKDLVDIREKHSHLQEEFSDKSWEAKKLEEQLRDHEQDADVRDQRLKDQNELLRHEHEVTVRKCESLTHQLQISAKELENKSEEKDLLHSRHDALTAQSQILQEDLSKAQTRVRKLEDSLEGERQHAQENDLQLRTEAKQELHRLFEEIDNLHREREDKESQYAAEADHWESQRRGLQSQGDKAEEQASGLQRTITKLQEVEGTLSSREMKLQEALESEKQRHKSEEAVLERQIQELNVDLDEKRRALDELRSDVSQAKEGLRVGQRELEAYEEKIQALEDEVDVLQSSLDEESEKAKEEISAIKQEMESLRSQLSDAQERLNHTKAENRDHHQQSSEKELLKSELRSANDELRQVKTEKQSLQDKLASANLDVLKLQATSESERREIKEHLNQAQDQVDETFKLEQDKLDLRTSKLKLESDISCIREERKGLLEKNAGTERKLEEEIARAALEESRLTQEVADLDRKLAAASGGRDRELTTARHKAQRLESRVQELEGRLGQDEHCDDATAELDMVQKDLFAARKKEHEYIEREAAQKDVVRDLRQKIGRLERSLHEAEVARLAVDSPKSSVAGSARKNELIEVQRQLADAHQHLKDIRAKSREDLKTLQRRLADSEKQVQSNLDTYEQQREQLEADLSATRQAQDTLQAKNTTANQTIIRLRTRISSLEKDIRANRNLATADNTIAEERKDLHEMLKDAKLQAEDLQLQITSRETSLAAATSREKELRAQLKRVREERTLQTQKSCALSTELNNLQLRYEHALDNLSQQQRGWEEERKAVASRVRFPNLSVTSLHTKEDNQNLELVVKEKEKRHSGELRGLAKQIQWLRAKCAREEGFRSGLAHEKKFLLMQIEMFEACNKIDLQLLSEMGIAPDSPKASTRLRLGDALRGKQGKREKKSPSLRAVGYMVLASCRMRRLSREWAGQKKVKEAVGRKLESMNGAKGK